MLPLKKNPEKYLPRQYRQLDYISQFYTDIRHVKGVDDLVTDALSRIDAINVLVLSPIDCNKLAATQQDDNLLSHYKELNKIFIDHSTTFILELVNVAIANS